MFLFLLMFASQMLRCTTTFNHSNSFVSLASGKQEIEMDLFGSDEQSEKRLPRREIRELLTRGRYCPPYKSCCIGHEEKNGNRSKRQSDEMNKATKFMVH